MNTLIISSALLYIAYIAIGLIVNYPQWKANGGSFNTPQPTSQALPSPQPETTPTPQPLPSPQPSQALQISSPTISLSIPSPTPQPTSQALPTTVKELRKLATSLGLPWKNAHGVNKHLSKAELLQALSQALS
jgi:hypothetical protein